MQRRFTRRKPPSQKPKKPRLGLRISRGLDILLELPEGTLSTREQSVLKRIQGIQRGIVGGNLGEADYANMKKIAGKLKIKLPSGKRTKF